MTEDNRNIETSMSQLTFDALASQITRVSDAMQAQAAHAVNLLLTSRNWIIGYYIVEFEQKGSDRAQYGDELLKTLAKKIDKKGLSWRRLYEFRQLYVTYPYLDGEIINYLQQVSNTAILRSLTAKLQQDENEIDEKLRSLTAKSTSFIASETWQTSPNQIFHRLSATHLILTSAISDPLKRAFYEQETIRGCWSVRCIGRKSRQTASNTRTALKCN